MSTNGHGNCPSEGLQEHLLPNIFFNALVYREPSHEKTNNLVSE